MDIYIKTDGELKKCEIWVDYWEKSDYKENEEYIQAINKYKDLKYKISVFVGGDKPLLPTITSLLEVQTDIIKAS